MKYVAASLVGALLITLALLISAKKEADNLKSQLATINAQSEKLEHEIKQHNETTQRNAALHRAEVERLENERIADINNARASFLAERMRLQASSESCREENSSLSRTYADHARSAAETERLLLRTLDEAEKIKAAAEKTATALEFMVEGDIDTAMSKVNS